MASPTAQADTRPALNLNEFRARREVLREPEVPPLCAQEIVEISRTVFVKDLPLPSDLIFVFGADDGRWELVASLYEQRYASTILLTGRAGENYFATGLAQAHRIRDALVSLRVPEHALIIEDQSDNTLQNVQYGKTALEQRGLSVNSILFVCKSHHSGRAWRTLAQHFPTAKLSCATYDASYEQNVVNHRSWHEQAAARRRVYGEFQRIQLYAKRGDIASHGPPA